MYIKFVIVVNNGGIWPFPPKKSGHKKSLYLYSGRIGRFIFQKKNFRISFKWEQIIKKLFFSLIIIFSIHWFYKNVQTMTEL